MSEGARRLLHAFKTANVRREKEENEYKKLIKKLRNNKINAEELNRLIERYTYYESERNQDYDSNNKKINFLKEKKTLDPAQSKWLNIH